MGLIWAGCQSYPIRTLVDPSSIPDQNYEITEYRGPMSGSYAVLFDIPDDGTAVVMQHTPFTERIGLGSPGAYVAEFETRIRGHRTLRISDEQGTVRGFLMVSNLLNDQVRPVGKGFIVNIEDPYFGYIRRFP
jgi:hypothetical protein